MKKMGVLISTKFDFMPTNDPTYKIIKQIYYHKIMSNIVNLGLILMNNNNLQF